MSKIIGKKINKLYRVSSKYMDCFDIVANNKKEVEKEIKRKGFNVRDWEIDRIE